MFDAGFARAEDLLSRDAERVPREREAVSAGGACNGAVNRKRRDRAKLDPVNPYGRQRVHRADGRS